MPTADAEQTILMKDILEVLKMLQANQTRLASNVDAITGRVNILAGIKEVQDAAATDGGGAARKAPVSKINSHESHDHADMPEPHIPESPSINPNDPTPDGRSTSPISVVHSQKPSVTSRIILTWVNLLNPIP
jgi:hypothetical protein